MVIDYLSKDFHAQFPSQVLKIISSWGSIAKVKKSVITTAV